MFKIETGAGEGGSKGPWISFKPKGSAKHGLPYKAWALRDKNEQGASTITRFMKVENPGIVLDIYAKGGQLCGSLKLGWSKSDGMEGVAPERRWNPSALQALPRPDETKTMQGSFVWRNCMSIRAAIGEGKTATWEDDGWGVYAGFDRLLLRQINPGFSANEGLCPMVRCVGYEDSGKGTNTTSIPVFEILRWVPRPDCLKEDAPQIATGFVAEPAPQPAYTPPPAAAPAPTAAADF